MKLKFDSSLDYQLEAINSVTNLFEGLPRMDTGFHIDFGRAVGELHNELGTGNTLTLTPDQFLKNLHQVQAQN